MFITRKKLEKIIKETVAREIRLREWQQLFDSIEEGDFLLIDGLEYEVKEVSSYLYVKYLDLRIGGQRVSEVIFWDHPEDIKFVMEAA